MSEQDVKSKLLASLFASFSICSQNLFHFINNTVDMFFTSKNNHFSLTISLICHVFSKPGTVFRGSRCWSLLKNVLSDDLFRSKVEIRYPAEILEPTVARPCFSQNYSDYCSLGTYCFFKGRLLVQDCPIFVFFCFLCASFYLTFVSPFFIIPQ